MNGESITAALRAYCTCNNIKNSNNKPPLATVRYMIERCLKTGSLNKASPPGKSNDVDMEEKVSCSILNQENNSSIRSIAMATGVSKSTVHRIMRHRLSLFPYKYQPTWTLCFTYSNKERVFEKRIWYCKNNKQRVSIHLAWLFSWFDSCRLWLMALSKIQSQYKNLWQHSWVERCYSIWIRKPPYFI